MRIAQLAPLAEPVPPRGYGGTELVISLLSEELVRRGHEVTLFAAADSKTEAKLISVIPESLRKSQDNFRTRWAAYEIRSLLALEEMQQEFDLVHNHMGWLALPLLSSFKVPVISTNHNPVKDYCRDIYFRYARLPYVSISDAYRSFNYADKLNYVATVYNGIDCSKYELPVKNRKEHLLFIGRISKAKGTAVAIEMAKELGLPLLIAGKVDESDRDYYESEVKTHLGKNGIEYLGELKDEDKPVLYAEARAVLYPIDFEEPFGLVMAESMAAGTPVLALARGSVQEVLADGESGIIAKSKEELVRRFGELAKIKPENCRSRAKELFSKEKMTDSYLELYSRLAAAQGFEGEYVEKCRT